MHDGNERVSAPEGIECFRNVHCYHHLVTRAGECLRYAFEKRRVGSNY
jgi:hypothetical protein